jgi:3-vinyl bacteriochlorophyllide hydratase
MLICHIFLTSKKLDTLTLFLLTFVCSKGGAGPLFNSRHIKSTDDFPKPAIAAGSAAYAPLYTPEQRQRRDESAWTLVQGILAPIQFAIFGVSLFLVIRFLATGEGQDAAQISIMIKTCALYAIMVTGSIWEKIVFDEWLFAKPFFWEDVFSMAVLALHTAYLVMLFNDWGTAPQQMAVALAAYATYVVNAGQFLYKLRVARLQTVPA